MGYLDQSNVLRVRSLTDQPDGLLTDLNEAQSALAIAERYITAWRRDPLIEETRFSTHQANVASDALFEARNVIDRARTVIDDVIEMVAGQDSGRPCSAPTSRREMARMQIRLPCDDWAPATARQLVREICPLWQVDDELQETTQVVVSELVDITAGHAGTASGLMLERGPRGLRVTIRASLAGLSRPGECSADPLHRRGRGLGLEMLENLTTAWGVDIQADRKTAWAEITK